MPTKERERSWFKKSKEFNRTLITKLSWMVASKRDSLCMGLLRSRLKNVSPIWRAIEKAKKMVAKGACYLGQMTTCLDQEMIQSHWIR